MYNNPNRPAFVRPQAEFTEDERRDIELKRYYNLTQRWSLVLAS